MIQQWLGARHVAFIPVSNAQVDVNVPPDFRAQVLARAFFDPDPVTGFDRSLAAYVHAMSSGRASLTGKVLPPVVAPDEDVIGAGLRSLPFLSTPFFDLKLHPFDFAVMVLPHGFGPHRGGYAWYPGDAVNGMSYYARTALYQDPGLSMRQSIGVWGMETLHMITRMGDLYYSLPPLGRYDVMSCSCGTHASAHTKGLFGWLADGSVAIHQIGTTATYQVHAISQTQPPPPGRVSAVRLKSKVSPGYLMIEARVRTDQYENAGAVSQGIPVEGALIYEVQGDTKVFLKASGIAGTATLQGEGLTVESSAVPGGFAITVRSRPTSRCAEIQRRLEALRTSLEIENDPVRRKQLISAIVQTQNELRQLNCRVPDSVYEGVVGRYLEELHAVTDDTQYDAE
ncbi:hypothetical protein [Agromyces binzhouensis]|uniref:hypothetical protein n=1 Tax=Agromyces binzhouensis TaxID=1817495 RepID=UPI00363F27C2